MASLADRLRIAADLTAAQWDPAPNGFGIVGALDQAAGPGPDADEISLDLWDAVVTHLKERLCSIWEREPGRTREQVAAMLRAAANANSAV